MTTYEFILKYKLISICRRVYGDELLRLAEALAAGGLRMMEVTFDQADPRGEERTAQAVASLGARFGGDMRFGAGTVLSPAQVDIAADAGAGFIISPNVNAAVIGRTRERGLVSIPGAMTPTEILAAHDAGADIVKLFPASWLGLGYYKDILGPISHVKLLVTGGITEDNVDGFLRLGAVGAGIGGRLADGKLMAAGDYAEITRRARSMADIAQLP